MPLSLIQLRKKEIRHEVRLIKKKTTKDEQMAVGQKICEKLIQMPEFKQAKSISIYVAYNQEVPTIPIIQQALELGKKVASPIVENGEIEFYCYDSIESLKEGEYGILEPTKELGIPGNDSLIIMPGVAFDKNRNRIGYGGGYYDRYLAKHPNSTTIAIAYDFQIYDEFDAEEKDYRPQKILTEKQLIQ